MAIGFYSRECYKRAVSGRQRYTGEGISIRELEDPIEAPIPIERARKGAAKAAAEAELERLMDSRHAEIMAELRRKNEDIEELAGKVEVLLNATESSALNNAMLLGALEAAEDQRHQLFDLLESKHARTQEQLREMQEQAQQAEAQVDEIREVILDLQELAQRQEQRALAADARALRAQRHANIATWGLVAVGGVLVWKIASDAGKASGAEKRESDLRAELGRLKATQDQTHAQLQAVARRPLPQPVVQHVTQHVTRNVTEQHRHVTEQHQHVTRNVTEQHNHQHHQHHTHVTQQHNHQHHKHVYEGLSRGEVQQMVRAGSISLSDIKACVRDEVRRAKKKLKPKVVTKVIERTKVVERQPVDVTVKLKTKGPKLKTQAPKIGGFFG